MFDYDYELKDTGRVEASGYGSVDGSAKVIDLGAGLVRGNLFIDVFQIAIGSKSTTFCATLIG